MLATESAQSPFGCNNMASSLHARGQLDPSLFSSSTITSHPKQYASANARPSANAGHQNHPPPSGPIQHAPPLVIDYPRLDNNIMNTRADMNSSLYQICLSLKLRLAEVPGFSKHIAEMDQEEAEVQDTTDPVTSMWNCFRRGYPLMTIYNALRPATPLTVDQSRTPEAKVGKAATFKFLQACLTEQKFPPNECFLITDLYGGDTTGFVKVTRVVNRVLDILSSRGLLLNTVYKSQNGVVDKKPPTLSYRQNVVKEIVMTERDYVHHLETLQQFKNEIEESGAIAGDAVHDIFLNLNNLLDFQRRFLIRIEQQNHLDESQQNWGQLFINYQEYFGVYEPFIANQTRCNNTVMREWEKLKGAPLSPALKGLVDTQHILAGFLLKPFQRLSKYPMLLNDLRLKGGLDEDRKLDLAEGIEAAQSILHRANDALAKEDRVAAVAELQSRVEDWKGHKIGHFGELLLYGSFTVLKGEGAKEVEREYKIYLFERILLCCKEINPNKPKNKMLGNNKPPTDKKGKLRLQLKGRIFMQNVTDVVSIKNDKQVYTIQIFWKGDPSIENFVIRFATEELMIKWRDQVTRQKQSLSNFSKSTSLGGTSDIKFTSLENQTTPDNPHLQDEDGDEDDSQGSTLVGGQDSYNASRNASNNSLRTIATLASTTMLPLDRSTNRAPLTRFPPQAPYGNTNATAPLTLQTNLSATVDSPAQGNSYFSPTADSPTSSRSSHQQNPYSFPPQLMPNNGWWPDENKHKTAPPIARTPSRDETGPPNSYSTAGRLQNPALAASTASHNAPQGMSQSRLRSQSTPDIHNPNNPGSRRYPNGQGLPNMDNHPMPPMPSKIPSHMAQLVAPVNRSQTNSPINTQLPIRSATQSPHAQREKLGRLQQVRPEYDNFYQYQRQEQPRSDPRSNYAGTYAGMAQGAMLNSANPVQPAQLVEADLDTKINYPTNLKVKTWFEPFPSHVTIVVPINIKYQVLADRIDSKMMKITSASIASNTAKLRYKDDQDLVNIETDEDVHTAIEEWGDVNQKRLKEGIVPDFELFWHEVGGGR